MDNSDPAFATPFAAPAGKRQRRFMESADINAAFRELFRPLRSSIRRGMSNEGQVYAIEMDSCMPGEILATDWIPPVSRGIDGPGVLADALRRRALFDRLFAEQRPEALLAYVCERDHAMGPPLLYVEIVSADGCYAAEYPIVAGRGWHHRDIIKMPHRRIDARALG